MASGHTVVLCQRLLKLSLYHQRAFPLPALSRTFSDSATLSAVGKTPLKKPVTPVGKFDLEDEAKKKELEKIREELRQKDEAEKMEEEEEEEDLPQMGEFINEETGERGGPRGVEPTRFGDWERKGRVTDF